MINKDDTMIVRSIIDLGHHLGLKVVAEGVESHEIEAVLTKLGCDGAQGYYFSRPLVPREFTEWQKQWQAYLAERNSEKPRQFQDRVSSVERRSY